MPQTGLNHISVFFEQSVPQHFHLVHTVLGYLSQELLHFLLQLCRGGQIWHERQSEMHHTRTGIIDSVLFASNTQNSPIC